MFGIIKCHRCTHIWIYTGQAISTICPSCKTTVRIPKCLIPINWDFDVTKGDFSGQNGKAIPFIEKWGEKFTLKFYIVATDSDYGQIIPFMFPIISGLVSQEELKETVGQCNVSGPYPLSQEIKTKLKRMECK